MTGGYNYSCHGVLKKKTHTQCLGAPPCTAQDILRYSIHRHLSTAKQHIHRLLPGIFADQPEGIDGHLVREKLPRGQGREVVQHGMAWPSDFAVSQIDVVNVVDMLL